MAARRRGPSSSARLGVLEHALWTVQDTQARHEQKIGELDVRLRRVERVLDEHGWLDGTDLGRDAANDVAGLSRELAVLQRLTKVG